MNKNREIEELYKQFRSPLLRFIKYKVNDQYIANEILNDVFFKASKSLDSLKEQTKIQSWLYKIASNQIIDYYRKNKATHIELNEELYFQEDTHKEDILSSLNCCMENFLDLVAKQNANALKAVYFEELSLKEYALKNNLKLSTVKSQVKRAKESIKDFFEQCCNFEKNNNNQIIKCISKATNKECN